MALTYGDISPAVAAYSVVRMLKRPMPAMSVLLPKPQLDYECTTCVVCMAPIGEPCRPVRRHFNWVGSRHAERMADARRRRTYSTSVLAPSVLCR